MLSQTWEDRVSASEGTLPCIARVFRTTELWFELEAGIVSSLQQVRVCHNASHKNVDFLVVL